MNIYVTTQGARIVREGRHLLVKKENDTYHTIFVEKINQLCLFGNVALTPAARSLLLRHNVDTVFFRLDGRYLGRFSMPESRNVMLRKNQFILLDNHEFGLAFVRAVVKGKAANMATLLMRVRRTRDKKEAGRAAAEIRALLPAMDTADSIDSLRGYEGRAGAVYFGALRLGFLNPLNFQRRVRRPPTDPINAVLSLLYTFLFNRMYAAVRAVNLDPYPGFLHVPDYGRHSLVMDLMEEFRVIVADTLTLSLFNLKILQKNDFEVRRAAAAPKPAPETTEQPDISRDPYGLFSDMESGEACDLPPQKVGDTTEDEKMEMPDGKPPVLLTSGAFARVLENFERKMATEFHYLPEDRKITLNDALTAQAGMFRKLVEGALREYQPLALR